MSRSRAGLPALAALVCFACSHTEGAPVAPAERAAPAGPASAADQPASRGLARDGAPVLGHLLIPSGTGLLADLRDRVAPAILAPQLRPEPLVDAVARGLGIDPRRAHSFDLQRPLGCVVGDLGVHPGKFACTFGYTGGAAAFVRDIGASPTDGHAAVLTRGQVTLFLDALGGDVVISGDPDFLARTQAYLARHLVERAPEVTAELEVVVYTHDVFARYGAAIEALAAKRDARKQAQMQEVMARAPAPLRQTLEILERADSEFDVGNVRELADHEQATFSLAIGEHGAALAWRFVPLAGGPFPAANLSRGRRLDAGFVEAMPDGALVLFAQNIDPRAVRAWDPYSAGGTTEEEVRRKIGVQAEALSALRGATVGREQVERETAEDVALYDGHVAHALLEQPGSLFGLGLLSTYRLVPGAAGREAWLAWTRRFSAETVLAAGVRKYLSWTFTPAAYAIDGAPVDRWTLRLSRQLLGRELENAIGAIAPTLVGEGLHIDRLEARGQVHFAIAPGAEEPLLRRALAARDGRASLHDDAALRRVLRRSSAADVVMAFDVASSLDWFERVLVHFGAIEAGTLPRTIGSGLDDVYVQFFEPDSGPTGGELVVGPGLLAGLRQWRP